MFYQNKTRNKIVLACDLLPRLGIYTKETLQDGYREDVNKAFELSAMKCSKIVKTVPCQ